MNPATTDEFAAERVLETSRGKGGEFSPERSATGSRLEEVLEVLGFDHQREAVANVEGMQVEHAFVLLDL